MVRAMRLWSMALTCALLLLAGRASADGFAVDLHAHLFMKPGLGWLFSGSFEKRTGTHFDDRLSSRVDAKSLEASGLRVVVVALFAHPVFVADIREAVREQIRRAQAFVREHPRWAIATSPGEARRLLARGKRILVLSLEGASGVLESEADLREFVDGHGIRIVTPLHLVDDRYGGVATMNGFQYVANPLGVVDRLLDPVAGDRTRRGLTRLGKRLAVELVRRGVWLDLTHASEAALDELVPIVREARQPLFFSHTSLRRYRDAERTLSDAMLAQVGRSEGIVGLLPSEDAFESIAPSHCPAGCEPSRCQGSVHAFARMFEEAAKVLGASRVMLGSDFNGGMRHLAPACGVPGPLAHPGGLVHPGQLPALGESLRRLGAPLPSVEAQLEAFLSAWERVSPVALEAPSLPPLPGRAQTQGPSLALELGLGVGAVEGRGVVHGRVRGWVRKDLGSHVPAEPEIVLSPLSAEIDLGVASQAIPLAQLRWAPVGIRAQDRGNRLWAEGGRLLVRRATPLEQAHRLRVSALGGGVQAMRRLAVARGEAQVDHLFVGLDLDFLGYEEIAFEQRRIDALRGVFLLDAGLRFGGRWVPAPPFSVLAWVGGQVDLTALVGAPGRFAHQADLLASGGLELGLPWLGSFVEGRWLGARTVTDEEIFRHVTVFHSGLFLRR